MGWWRTEPRAPLRTLPEEQAVAYDLNPPGFMHRVIERAVAMAMRQEKGAAHAQEHAEQSLRMMVAFLRVGSMFKARTAALLGMRVVEYLQGCQKPHGPHL